jgi:DNA-directed RNA polymerase specialized sigma24 family protein
MDAHARRCRQNRADEEGTLLSDAACDQLWFIGRLCAEKYGYYGEAADDCAQGFVVHMLDLHRRSPWLEPQKTGSSFWLFTCSHNFVKNVFRKDLYFQAHECPLQPSFGNLPTHEPSPYNRMLRRELYERLVAPVSHLTSRQQTLFVGYFLREESVETLARSLHQHPNTTRQALWAMRHRLCHLLEESQMDWAEIQDYLYELALRD